MLKLITKHREIRPQWQEEELKKLAEEMAAKGHFGLTIRKNKLATGSLSFLQHFTHLESVAVFDISRGVSVLSELPNLKHVFLYGVSTKDLSFLKELPQLEYLRLNASRLKDMPSIGELTNLKALTLSGYTKLEDISFISRMEKLQFLEISGCSGVLSLPDCSRLKYLKRIELNTVNRLVDISGGFRADNLQELFIQQANSLPITTLLEALNHPSLRDVYAGFGNTTDGNTTEVIAKLRSKNMFGDFYGSDNEEFVLE